MPGIEIMAGVAETASESVPAPVTPEIVGSGIEGSDQPETKTGAESEAFATETVEENLIESPEPSVEEQISGVETDEKIIQEGITEIDNNNAIKEARLNELRKKFDLPAKNLLSKAASEIERRVQLELRKKECERRKNELIARLTEEIMKEVLREMLEKLFEEFQSMDAETFASIKETGLTPDGKTFESSVFGPVDPATSEILAQIYEEGVNNAALHRLLKSMEASNSPIYANLSQNAENAVNRLLSGSNNNNEVDAADGGAESEPVANSANQEPANAATA